MKRLRYDDPRTDFDPLEITDDILDDPTLEGPWFTSVRCIPFDPDSPPCFNADLASAQATLVHKTTASNEVFLRTYHPALKSFTSVWLMEERNGRQIWVLRDSHKNCNYTHAGGLEIHQTPRVTFYQTNGVFLTKNDTIKRAINPRAALSNEDLSKFRDMFPFAVGVRVYVGGGIVVLYRNPTELYASLDKGVAYTVSNWEVAFDVIETTPTTAILDLGEQITTEDSIQYPTACIGVRIRLPSGQPALTTVTHGFVTLPGTGLLAKAFDWMWRKKEALLRFKTPRTMAADLPLIGPHPIGSKFKSFSSWFTTNSPIGKPVFLHSTSKAIGSIGATFDAPSSFSPYPSGYICDLSLIVPVDNETEGFPEIGSPSSMPTIDGWADLKRALGGDSVFVTANLAIESGRQTKTGKVLTPSEYLDVQYDLAELKREAMIEGKQYLWDTETCRQSVALLWRTCSPPHEGPSHVLGFSGSVLCLGKTTDKTAKAVVFQNFQVPQPGMTGPHPQNHPSKKPTWNLNGGFLLPDIIRHCRIETPTRPQENP
ncbi:hypothetical protein K456DRAFT_1852467 [Colletotrichum gloeosporioides 23]|nr:hypothetical protein K456DRAFT_1852467 [Colletotrichum gloeosporioides 23]